MENKEILEQFKTMMEDFRNNTQKMCEDYKKKLDAIENLMKKLKDNK